MSIHDTLYGQYRSSGFGQVPPQEPPPDAQPNAANLLATLKARAEHLRRQLADMAPMRAELDMLDRMIAAAEGPKPR